MKILVVGLGLIGGSICKALKKNTDNIVIGMDTNKEIEALARNEKSIDYAFNDNYSELELVIICLYPQAAKEFFSEASDKLSKSTIVTDVCGIKGNFALCMNEIAKKNQLNYVSIHPMAGREVGGYENSIPELFNNANFIITPFENSDNNTVELLEKISRQIGAKKIVITSPQEHDEIIAYTSQLAHIVSSAYVKSPVLEKECGFSGGSFQDMTRIATMNENMWTSLFIQNKDNLVFEIDTIIDNLKKYRNAIADENSEELSQLIKEGRLLKEDNLKKRIGEPN